MPRPRLSVCLVAGALVLAACGSDGRTLAPAPEVPVAPETTTTTVAGPDAGFTTDDPTIGLNLSSPSFAGGEMLDPDFTCDGLNVPPPLVIGGTPAGAAELAVTMVDRSADGFVHWVVTNLSAATTQLESGVIPPSAVTAKTDSGIDGWDGPCPPAGDAPHDYVFSVYAMAEPIGLTPGLEGRDAIALIEAAAISSTLLIGRYAAQG
ncbi:YbhB/YbcL family Raf kinase inhibitor-like protein [Actinospongicola halichondriae]|uniref:YbhB/YbcL family Raf kinase inhibitor-like protein n=1 Tax=Actinospongicola halichondriae TaxID=3236844 RepID=UPI003D3E200F